LPGREDGMGGRTLGLVLVAVGVVLFVISAFAGPLGLGDDDSVGWKQVTGMIVGGVVVAAGLALTYLRRGGEASPQPDN
jgi:hypothetical protein